MENVNPISSFFFSKTAVDVSPEIQKIEKNVIALRTTDTIIDAVNILEQYHILCAPVINEEIPQIVGLFGLEDVTSYLAQKINSNTDQQNLASLLVGNETILNLVNFSGRNPMELIRYSDSALAAASLLSNGLHRIIVLDANQCVCAMITQADLARLVHNNLSNPAFTSILSLPLSKLGVTPRPVRSVLDTDSVKKVLNIMHEFGGVVAVVDNSNKLVGNFSPSDFKSIFEANAPHLGTSIREFLTKVSSKALNAKVITLNSTLLEVTNTFVENKIHHLWIVDDAGVPSACFSLTDYLNVLCGASVPF